MPRIFWNKHFKPQTINGKERNHPPAWYQAMQEWQREDDDRRSVIVIATDNTDSYVGLIGYSIPLAVALAVAMEQNENLKEITVGALEANKSPLAKIAMALAMEKFRSEHNIGESESDNNEQSSEDSFFKDMLKSILSGLADKS